MSRLVFFTPSDAPVGGIAKVLDYAVHAARMGREVVMCCADMRHAGGESPLFDKPYFVAHGKDVIAITDAEGLEPRPGDIAFFTLPSSHEHLGTLYAGLRGARPRFIHLLQNVRVANVAFDKGYSFRLLPKRLHRICITQEVMDAVAPYVEAADLMRLIPHGFDFHAFAKEPRRDDPIDINFNTFKGNLGHTIVEPYREDTRIRGLRVADKGISWRDLQDQYHRASVFLATPLAEEGLYLPGLEAMASGHLVITPDACGNRFYCDFDDNCLLVPLGDVKAYQERLEWAIAHWRDEVFEMRNRAHARARDLGLDSEFENFRRYLEEFDLT